MFVCVETLMLYGVSKKDVLRVQYLEFWELLSSMASLILMCSSTSQLWVGGLLGTAVMGVP